MSPCYQRHEIAPGVHQDIPHEHEGVRMTKTMAEVLAEHTRRSGIRNMAIHCECGWSESTLTMWSSRKSFAAHQVAALSAAGFGLVADAKAEAWDEGMEAMYATTSSEWPPIPEANPYRKPRP